MKISAIFLLLAAAAVSWSPYECQAKTPETFPVVISPDIPRSMDFCGKTIDLDRNDMYERFDRELTSMIYSHGSTMLTLKRANKYFPVIAPLLKAYAIPEDMLYLVCIESTLNPRAYSGAKAAGLWQFIPSTAKQYGLEVNDEVDERYDIKKATAAACRYLRKAYEKYGDWPTVMASYNAGMGRISTELDKQMANDSYDLYLNEETSRYVFRVMAMKALMQNPSYFGYKLKPEQFYRPAEVDIVEVSGPVEDWPSWAADRGISYAQLKDENPWIRSKSLTNRSGKTYKVRVPKKHSLSRSKQPVSIYDSNWVK